MRHDTGRAKSCGQARVHRALVIDIVFIGMGVIGYVVTKNWAFLIAGLLMGSIFLLPALLTYSKFSERK